MEKEIEIGQAWPEANKTEVRINFIIQLSFQSDPCALNITRLMLDLKFFRYILIRVTIKECNKMPVWHWLHPILK